MVAKVMATYSMSVTEVLGTKKSLFFWLHRQAERLEAQADRRQVQLLLAAQSEEGFKLAMEALDDDLGAIYEWGKFQPQQFEITTDDGLDPEFDRSALRALKARHGV